MIKTKSVFYYLYRVIEGILSVNAYGLNHNKTVFSMNNWTDMPLQTDNYNIIMSNRLNSYIQRLHILMEKVIEFNSKAIFVSQSNRRTYDIINGQLIATSDTQKYNQFIINGIDYYHMSRLLNAHTKSVCDSYKECIFLISMKN